jgi:hypothetical protein
MAKMTGTIDDNPKRRLLTLLLPWPEAGSEWKMPLLTEWACSPLERDAVIDTGQGGRARTISKMVALRPFGDEDCRQCRERARR